MYRVYIEYLEVCVCVVDAVCVCVFGTAGPTKLTRCCVIVAVRCCRRFYFHYLVLFEDRASVLIA